MIFLKLGEKEVKIKRIIRCILLIVGGFAFFLSVFLLALLQNERISEETPSAPILWGTYESAQEGAKAFLHPIPYQQGRPWHAKLETRDYYGVPANVLTLTEGNAQIQAVYPKIAAPILEASSMPLSNKVEIAGNSAYYCTEEESHLAFFTMEDCAYTVQMQGGNELDFRKLCASLVW